MNEIEPAVAKVLELYRSSVYARDAGTLIKLYDHNARVFDTWGVWSYEGAPAWQVAIDGWFASLGTERVKVSFDEVTSIAIQDFAYVSAIVTYAGFSSEGEPLRAMQNRMTWVLKKSGHVLRIVHEHTSAPAGFDDGKVILQRVDKP